MKQQEFTSENSAFSSSSFQFFSKRSRLQSLDVLVWNRSHLYLSLSSLPGLVTSLSLPFLRVLSSTCPVSCCTSSCLWLEPSWMFPVLGCAQGEPERGMNLLHAVMWIRLGWRVGWHFVIDHTEMQSFKIIYLNQAWAVLPKAFSAEIWG